MRSHVAHGVGMFRCAMTASQHQMFSLLLHIASFEDVLLGGAAYYLILDTLY